MLAVAGSPSRKGAMETTVCVLHCLHPEQGEGKASAVVEAAFQVAGSGVGGDMCGKEISTPKGTESENQPFSSSHPDPLCVPLVCCKSLLLRGASSSLQESNQSAASLWSPPDPHVSPAGAGPDES